MDKKEIQKLSEEELLDKLGTSLDGLTEIESSHRLVQYGPNVFKNNAKNGVLRLLFKQFKSSLIYLLIIATLLAFILKDYSDGIIILIILVINTGLGFYQEYKSENAVEKLQKLVNKEILIKREGKETLVDERNVVRGDLVILREGDIVPADIRLYRVTDLSVNESQLTGESSPVTKKQSDLVFAGSTVEGGEAEGFIYATANDTELGKIAHLSSSTKRTTKYEQSLQSFSSFLIKFTFLTLAFIFILKIIIDRDNSSIASLALFIVALSITVVPEAMPVIATITLSKGAMRLAKQHVIAKTLSSVEDLGNINVLCSDKTGTLTENNLKVKEVVADDTKLFQMLAIGGLETLDEKRKKFQSSFDRAFIGYVPKEIQEKAKEFKRLAELPFDPVARRRRVIFSSNNKTYLVEIGSVETLLSLTESHKQNHYLKTIKADGESGLRHLGIAYKEIDYEKDFDILKHEKGLTFVGFASLEDPLRPTTAHTINLAKKLGLTIKILSGDSKEVTHYVASEVGLINKAQIVFTGDELDDMNDEKLGEVVQANDVFARLNPDQKYRIIKLLKQQGNTVGYQGDGINDAPALKLADVAIAVNNATDVAQASADILLLRNDLGVIVNGVRYGRTIFSNINKYIRYTMIGNFGNFFALSALYLVSSTTLPLLPIQLIMTGLLTDIPLITIATDNVDIKELLRPSKYNTHSLMFISLFMGTFTALTEIMFFVIVRKQPVEVAQTSLFLFLTISQLAIILCVRNKAHFWKAVKLSLSLKIALILDVIVTIAITYIGITRQLFSFAVTPASTFLLIAVGTVVYLIVLDIVKVWFYDGHVFGQNE